MYAGSIGKPSDRNRGYNITQQLTNYIVSDLVIFHIS